ncbi:hypothetical protein TWF694_006773 [Orbilia ellipsospora]|uniref:Uncharacterized protein n=1 Tax=Orbilia ellipsospora TaxID=2528407 RepID=A0AAV9XMQ1_9PEZI
MSGTSEAKDMHWQWVEICQIRTLHIFTIFLHLFSFKSTALCKQAPKINNGIDKSWRLVDLSPYGVGEPPSDRIFIPVVSLPRAAERHVLLDVTCMDSEREKTIMSIILSTCIIMSPS